MACYRKNLTNWYFAPGDSPACLSEGRKVRVPHTWSVRKADENHIGKGWYRTAVLASSFSESSRAFLVFHGAYRDTEVYVNGTLCGSHVGCGYTPFTVEITSAVVPHQVNEIIVSVDNRFSTEALPYDRSFDWANDGGLYRPVEYWVTGPASFLDTEITARPLITSYGRRQHAGPALFAFRTKTEFSGPECTLRWALYRGASNSITEPEPDPVLSGSLPCAEQVNLNAVLLSDAVYWHFDSPELYTLCLSIEFPDGSVSDRREWVIGFRELKVMGSRWYLNGEPVRLPGTEWMPGSTPRSGMAESRSMLQDMLCSLKACNTVLTRFHWQQDDWVYDWCDRYGLLVQEEIPFWGKQPEGDPKKLWPVARQQIDEMISAHRHHPSIIAWGVGNELSAQTWPVQRYIRRAVAAIHEKDPDRLANYVSNTAFACPEQDGTGDGDVLMINDYIGTWHQGFDQADAWNALVDAHPGRVLIPSEFGLCEPAFEGGDPRRTAIFLEKLNFYRTLPSIGGTIYFCLNDYRTHMGEEGKGRMKRRVHGSTDLYGIPKPSYDTVRREYAPLVITVVPGGLKFTCRNDLPAYTVSGYKICCGAEQYPIPDLMPGEDWFWEGNPDAVDSILRPSGFAFTFPV